MPQIFRHSATQNSADSKFLLSMTIKHGEEGIPHTGRCTSPNMPCTPIPAWIIAQSTAPWGQWPLSALAQYFFYLSLMNLWKSFLYILQLRLFMMKTQKCAKYTETLNGVKRIGNNLVQVVRKENFYSIDPVKCNLTDAPL